MTKQFIVRLETLLPKMESRSDDSSPRALLAAVFVVGLALRLWLAFTTYGNYDQTSFRIVAEITRRHGNVYAETSRYNYSPVWAFIVAGLDAARPSGLPFPAAVKGFLSLVDVGNAVLLGRLARSLGRVSWHATAFYLLNPVAIMLVGYHGQFETLAATPILLAALLLARPARPGRLPLVWALGTLSLAVKHITLFSVWTLFLAATPLLGGAVALMAGALGAFGALFLPYLPEGLAGILRNVVGYRGIPHPYGLSIVMPRTVLFPLFLAVMSVLPVVASRLRAFDIGRRLELAAVGLLVFIPGMGECYILLPALFGSVAPGLFSLTFAAVGYGFLLTGPNNLQALQSAQPWNVVWLSLAVWLVALLTSAWRWSGERPTAPA
jgi:hypothetical protein